MKNRIISLILVITGLITVIRPQVTENIEWKAIEEKARNCVVQVEAKCAEFNWLEPYKAPEQKDGCGSAFFISPDGHLLTNFHVIDQAKSISLFLPIVGRKHLEANIVGAYPEIDCALLQATPDTIRFLKKKFGAVPYLKLGDSDASFSTKSVLALGYPFGQRYLKSSTGIISGREYIGGSSYMHVTAPLNPGNSGGPLINNNGEVIGINSAILPNTNSVGLSIAINDIKLILENLVSGKLVRKPRLGFGYNPLTLEHAKSLGINTQAGISLTGTALVGTYVNHVIPGSLSQQAGLQAGDILTTINSSKIDQYGDVSINYEPFKISLNEYFMRLPLNKKIDFSIYRDGHIMNIKCDYKYQEKNVRFIYPDYEPEALDYEIFGGLCIMQLRQNHIEALKNSGLFSYLDDNNSNKNLLVVTKIFSGSVIALTNCLSAGMVIESINDAKVGTLDELRQALLNNKTVDSIKLKTDSQITTVISLNKIIKDETRLSRAFKFDISNTMKQLINTN